MTTLLRRLLRDARGTAAIEFAIIAPVMFTVLLGTIEMGRMYYVRQGLEYATQEAARFYMLNPTTAESNVTTLLRARMVGGLGASVTPSYSNTASCNGNSTVTCTTISATYNFTFMASYLGLGSKTLEARAQAVRY